LQNKIPNYWNFGGTPGHNCLAGEQLSTF